jgi:transposase InsO family protein
LGEITTEHPGYLVAQDVYYVGTIKGVGKIYQQTVIDTYSRVANAKLYNCKTPITSADVLNDRTIPFFAEHGVDVLRVLTDRGTEFCGRVEHHAYELYLSIEGIEHTKTKANSPQTNGICERFHRTMKQEFYDTAFRRKIYSSIEDLQKDVDCWLEYYNNNRSHSGKYCYGKTPMQTFLDSKHIALEKSNESMYTNAISDSLNLSDCSIA